MASCKSTPFLLSVREQGAIGRYSIQYEKFLKHSIIQEVSIFQKTKVVSCFDNQISAMAWHPTIPSLMAVGSEFGDLFLLNEDKIYPYSSRWDEKWRSVEAIKFSKTDNLSFISLFNGSVCRADIHTAKLHKIMILRGNELLRDKFTSLDISCDGDLLAIGNSRGNLVQLKLNEKKIITKQRLHEGPILHVEFSTYTPWLFVTASVDNFVRLWDIRNLQKNVEELEHPRGVVSARFSLCRGTRLLTTDHDAEMRIFSGPTWKLDTTIHPPENMFLHMAYVKASWHPLEDMVLIGRSPSYNLSWMPVEKERRIDFYDAADGEYFGSLPAIAGYEYEYNLTEFNSLGSILAGGMGGKVVLWERGENPN